MSHPRWLIVGALIAVAAVLTLAATLGGGPGSSAGSPSNSVDPSASAKGLGSSASASRGASASAAPSATPAPTTPVGSAPTKPPRASGAASRAWAEFVSHLNDDRSTAVRLNGALSTAANAQDTTTVRTAAVAILDFVDTERSWLREHPPADCYADAHASAGAMLDAYAAAAERFIDWTAADGVLARLAALGVAVEAADAARIAATAFGTALEGTRCPA